MKRALRSLGLATAPQLAVVAPAVLEHNASQPRSIDACHSAGGNFASRAGRVHQ
jgi:hypothetical protein